MQAADYFRRIPLFSDLSPGEIVEVLRIARVVQFEPGALLCARGEKGECAFVIEEGEAAVRAVDEAGLPVVIARVGPGEVVGELSLVDGHPRSADVVATRALRGYRIDRAELDALRRAMHPAAFKILRRIAITVSDRLRDVNDAIGQALSEAQPGERASDAESRAAARASRELTRASLPQAMPARPARESAPRASRPGAAQTAEPAARASRAGAVRAKGVRPAAATAAAAPASAARPAPAAAPEASAAGSGSLWGSMLAKLRGAPWK